MNWSKSSESWNAAGRTQRNYRTRVQKVHAPVGDKLYVKDNRLTYDEDAQGRGVMVETTCDGCGYHDCSCERLPDLPTPCTGEFSRCPCSRCVAVLGSVAARAELEPEAAPTEGTWEWALTQLHAGCFVSSNRDSVVVDTYRMHKGIIQYRSRYEEIWEASTRSVGELSRLKFSWRFAENPEQPSAPTPGTFAWLKTLPPETMVRRAGWRTTTASCTAVSVLRARDSKWRDVTDLVLA